MSVVIRRCWSQGVFLVAKDSAWRCGSGDVNRRRLIDRVIDQVPEPAEKPFGLNGTVTLLLGRASGGA